MLDFQSPLQQIDAGLFIKRDDLIPFSFGGNKVRIAEEFFSDMARKGNDCIIGYGNARSNLSRAIANRAYSLGIPCHIVSPDDDDGKRLETSNSRLVKSCGADIHFCEKTRVAETVSSVIESCKEEGLRPYYIYGDIYGKGNEGVPVSAYEKAYQEIATLDFDYIFLPTGTGMTQAGLIAGQEKYGGNSKIVGISVARDSEREIEIIKGLLNAYGVNSSMEILVDDTYRCGGYGKYNSEIAETIDEMYRQYGIPLDPTYTGKAFWGMSQWLKKNNVADKRILFWHTGGMPLFFDYLKGE